MSYPKPLSKRNIDKLFSTWEQEKVEKLHRYFKAFSDLYGCVQLKDAWKVFKQFEPKIHKKEFLDFASIARQEKLPYYIFEIDEIYCDEKRIDTERFIVNRELVGAGIMKFNRVYKIVDEQMNKPYYAVKDLFEVAAHRFNDEKLKAFFDDLVFSGGEYCGRKMSEVIYITKSEKFFLEYYKSEARRAKIRKEAEIPLSDKIMRELKTWTDIFDNPLEELNGFLEEAGFFFESDTQLEKLAALMMEYINNSHLWRNCGYTPSGLAAKMGGGLPKSISFGKGLQKAFEDGSIDKKELVRYINSLGIDVE